MKSIHYISILCTYKENETLNIVWSYVFTKNQPEEVPAATYMVLSLWIAGEKKNLRQPTRSQ